MATLLEDRPGDEMLSAAEVRKLLGVSTATMHRWRKSGVGPRAVNLSTGTTKTGRRWAYAVRDIRNFLSTKSA